jgi:5,10-methenyltetrahydrofolate synthetase
MDGISQTPENAAKSAVIVDDETRAWRAGIRRDRLSAREAIAPAEHAHWSRSIAAHLEKACAALAPGVVAFCFPVRGEFDAQPLVCRLLDRGWRAQMPVALDADAPMRFRDWSPDCAMTCDRHGIPIPDGLDSVTTPDLLLVPLVAFDARGYRLGYGGGYFDRTLAQLGGDAQSWGVGFEIARVADIRPQAHDRRLDAVITEAGWFPSPA